MDMTVIDNIEVIENSLIQHGKDNDRVYIMKMDKKRVKELLKEVNEICALNKYSKIFAKIPKGLKQTCIEDGFKIEAEVPNFFLGKEDCLFIGKYFSEERMGNKFKRQTEDVIDVAKSKEVEKQPLNLSQEYDIRKCTLDHVEDMCDLYRSVFISYPFPIFDTEYIKSTMKDNVIYFGAWEGEKLIALSSIELYREDMNAEMTDFATSHEYRGKNISLYLLSKMEEELKKMNIKTAYSIARSISYGMNSTFAKLGYEYGGTLINNTNICGQLENMNVWYKSIK